MTSAPRLLLLSNSSTPGFPYLSLWREQISEFVGSKRKAIFIPFAAVDQKYDEYTADVVKGLPDLSITGVHEHGDMEKAISESEIVIVGGGNTYTLLSCLYKKSLLQAIKDKIHNGGLYIGWSAGSVVTNPDISTSNDMAISWPESNKGLGFLDIHVNPHYNNFAAPGYQGETRDDRLNEAMMTGERLMIVALSEGTALIGEDHSLFILRSKQKDRKEGSKLVVKVWVIDFKDPGKGKFTVVDVPVEEQLEDKFSLEQFLPVPPFTGFK